MVNEILNLAKSIDKIEALSTTLKGWSLAVIGGTILIVVSNSYVRPSNIKIRLCYLLFVPGWVSMAVSMYYADMVTRRAVAATFAASLDQTVSIIDKINEDFISQQDFFKYSLSFFTVWLIVYLIWWVFASFKNNNL